MKEIFHEINDNIFCETESLLQVLKNFEMKEKFLLKIKEICLLGFFLE
jgi:hypothetical protein